MRVALIYLNIAVLVVLIQLNLYWLFWGEISLLEMLVWIKGKINFLGWILYLNFIALLFTSLFLFFDKERLKPYWSYKVLDLIAFSSPLVGLGGTLIGIALGISGVSIDKPEESIRQLFSGVDISLFTSIFGVFILIASGVILKVYRFEQKAEAYHEESISKSL